MHAIVLKVGWATLVNIDVFMVTQLMTMFVNVNLATMVVIVRCSALTRAVCVLRVNVIADLGDGEESFVTEEDVQELRKIARVMGHVLQTHRLVNVILDGQVSYIVCNKIICIV